MKKSKKIFITLCGIATTAILPVATISCNDDKLAEKNGKEKADAALKQANTLAEELKKNPDYSKILETLNKEIAEATKSFKEAGSYSDYPAIISKLSAAVENAKSEQQKVDQANKKIADENLKIKEGAKELLKLSEKIQSFADTIALTITKLERKFQIDETFKKQLISTIELLNKKSAEVKTFATVNTIKKDFVLSELESFKEFNTSWLEKIVSEWEEVKKAWSKELAEIKAEDDKKLAEENQKIKEGAKELLKLSEKIQSFADTIALTITKLERKFQIDETFKKQLISTIELLNKKSAEVKTFATVNTIKKDFVLSELESFKEFNTSWLEKIVSEWEEVKKAWSKELAEIKAEDDKKLAEENQKIKEGAKELLKLSEKIQSFADTIALTITKLERKFQIDETFKKQLISTIELLNKKSAEVKTFATVNTIKKDFVLSELESFKEFNTSWLEKIVSEWEEVKKAWSKELAEIKAEDDKKLAEENQKIKEGAKELLKLSEKIQSFADTIALTITKLERKFQIDETFKKQLISTIELLNKKSAEVKTFATVNTIKKDFLLSELESFNEFNTSWLEKIVSEWEEVKKAWSKELAEIKAEDDKKLAEENQKIKNGVEELKKINNEAFELSKTVNKTIAELEKKFKIDVSFKEQLKNFGDDLLDKSRQIDEFTTVTSTQEGFTLAELESFKEITTTWFNGMKSEWARVQEAWKDQLKEISAK
uniref:Vaa surface lipoprotein adhesin n=1 Tax=Metamycoplasma hominis TaxID=2098 RepID=Q49543_METHO|nr:Vaa surface lipoprotein adhesin precursor [Metamycoplasma hominis]